MPPPIAHRPKGSCPNFPLCKNLQKRPKQNGKKLPRLDFCAQCTESTRSCSHLGCTSPAAPGFKKDKQPLFCSTHYGDPAHAASRSWNLCSNATLGCRRLSTESSRGSCYACRSFEYPCKFALVGCPCHVRGDGSSTKKRQYSCLSDEGYNGCLYDPSKKRRCAAPLCPDLPAVGRGPFCISCEGGKIPCPELCGRRAEIGNRGYCSLCKIPSASCQSTPSADTPASDSNSGKIAVRNSACATPMHDASIFG